MKKKQLSMEVVNPHAAGVDVGSRSHFVAIGQAITDVKEFGVYDCDLQNLAKWLIRLQQWLWKAQVLIGKIYLPYCKIPD